MLISYKNIKYYIKMYAILLLFNFNIFSMTISLSVEKTKSQILIEAVEINNVDKVKEIVKSLDPARDNLEDALKSSILLAAENGYADIFYLLRRYVPVPTYSKAYHILEKKYPNIDLLKPLDDSDNDEI